MHGFEFDRYTLEGLIAVTTGIENPKPSPSAIMLWQADSIGAFAGLKAGMDELHPQPGFSRLSEIEAQIKAREAKASENPTEP